MSQYFVVVDPSIRRESFVAGFAEQALAVSYANCEREHGRDLVVLDGVTGEQVFPAEEGSNRPLRQSGMRLRTPATSE